MSSDREKEIRFTEVYKEQPLNFGRRDTEPDEKRDIEGTSDGQSHGAGESHEKIVRTEKFCEDGEKVSGGSHGGLSNGTSGAEEEHAGKPDLDTLIAAGRERIRSMRDDWPSQVPVRESRRVFYLEGILMAKYEADYHPMTGFSHFFPTYEDMTEAQQRSYFAWRRKWRIFEKKFLEMEDRKMAEEPSASLWDRYNSCEPESLLSGPWLPPKGYIRRNSTFFYLHAFELINNTDMADPLDEYRRLSILCRVTKSEDPYLCRRLRGWRKDFAVYYDLDPALAYSRNEEAKDGAMRILENFEKSNDGEINSIKNSEGAGDIRDTEKTEDTHSIFEAIRCLSSRDPSASPFYRKYPEDMEQVVVRAYAAVGLYFYMTEGQHLLERAFGEKDEIRYTIFEYAVFYDHIRRDHYQYSAGPSETFYCTDGEWMCERYRYNGNTSWLIGDICHEAERILRLRYSYGRPLKRHIDSNDLSDLITETVDNYLREKEEAAHPKIKIDFSRLDTIRSDAAHTRDQLIVDEEDMDEENADSGPEEIPDRESPFTDDDREISHNDPDNGPDNESPMTGEDGESPLTGEQAAFLQLLLDGGDWKGFIDSHADILSVGILVDDINEALYDEIGDTVIELDGDRPVLIEDYREDVMRILGI
ncbi:MAG: TerB N-terminal domain-containing protein [Eubacteriales bacterium]|jgi:hypothetical protein